MTKPAQSATGESFDFTYGCRVTRCARGDECVKAGRCLGLPPSGDTLANDQAALLKSYLDGRFRVIGRYVPLTRYSCAPAEGDYGAGMESDPSGDYVNYEDAMKIIESLPAPSEMGTPDVEQAVKWLASSAKHDDEQTLFGNADQARKIIKMLRAFPSATPCSGWVSVLEKLPEGWGPVLVAHPAFAITSRDMFGVEIRSAATVRQWVGDKDDPSMRGMQTAYWQPMPKGPA